MLIRNLQVIVSIRILPVAKHNQEKNLCEWQ